MLVGLGGNDLIDGGSNDDTIYGDNRCPPNTSGAPYYCVPAGRPGNDRLFGSAGLDTLVAGVGADHLTGGPDNDALSAVDGVGDDPLARELGEF